MLQKKPGALIFIILAYISSKKMKDIHFYCLCFKNTIGLAIIQDFAAHWAIKDEQMVNVWIFHVKSESSQLESVWISIGQKIKLGFLGSLFLGENS